MELKGQIPLWKLINNQQCIPYIAWPKREAMPFCKVPINFSMLYHEKLNDKNNAYLI